MPHLTKPVGRILAGVAALLFFLALIALGLMRWRDPLPVGAGDPPPPSEESAWWLHPTPLSSEEAAAQQWLADMTFRLAPEQEAAVWRVGGSQHGVFSIRYQAAFSGYAAAAFGMRTPAYTGLTHRIIGNTVDRIADRAAWSYISSYWSQEPWFPDPCARGNVMYTGHLMMLMALDEMLSGDSKFNRDGVSLAWDERNRFSYTTRRLAEVSASQIREGEGGITCEPGLVFFACNNHPHVAFRLLEGMGYGDWHAESRKWEAWALSRLRATAGGGAFRLVHHVGSGLSFPRGMPGFDGWCLLWYAPWASDPADLPELWRLARSKIDWSLFDGPPKEEPEAIHAGDCCDPVKVPSSATASFLAAAARACGDGVSAERLERWLDRHFRKETGGRLWLETDREWRLGVSANRFLALAQAHGSDLRAMVRRPLPRTYFDGILLESVAPDVTPVLAAFRDAAGNLTIELDGPGDDVTLRFRNAGDSPKLSLPEGLSGRWEPGTGSLILERCGRVTLTVAAAGP